MPVILKLFKRIETLDNIPWIVMEDFNEILYHHEKWDEKEQSENLMTNFRNTLVHCGFFYLGMRGNHFT